MLPFTTFRIGAGFSGFWYHLGLFSSLSSSASDAFLDFDYYCYSSACLSLVFGYLRMPVDHVFAATRDIQEEWLRGDLSSYDMVDEFVARRLLHRLDQDDDRGEALLAPLLTRLHVLSTSLDATGAVVTAEVFSPSNVTELVAAIKRTTWIPFLTGRGWFLRDNDNSSSNSAGGRSYLDGYFSVPLHPPCRFAARVPFSWSTYMHSLNPGMGQETVYDLFAQGQGRVARHRHGTQPPNDNGPPSLFFLETTRTTTTHQDKDGSVIASRTNVTYEIDL